MHLGHLRMADAACRNFSLDRMIFMPCGNPYLKKGVSPDEDRLELTRLSVDEFNEKTSNAVWEVSDMEIRREGDTYTFETIAALKDIYPNAELYFLVGEDSLRYMENWVNPQLIFADCIVIAAARPSRKHQTFDAGGHEMHTGSESSGTEERIEDLQARLMKMFPAEIHIMRFDDPLSASDIRKAVSEGKDINGMVTEHAGKYITEKGMYI